MPLTINHLRRSHASSFDPTDGILHAFHTDSRIFISASSPLGPTGQDGETDDPSLQSSMGHSPNTQAHTIQATQNYSNQDDDDDILMESDEDEEEEEEEESSGREQDLEEPMQDLTIDDQYAGLQIAPPSQGAPPTSRRPEEATQPRVAKGDREGDAEDNPEEVKDDDEDDGAILARLFRRAEKMRKRAAQPHSQSLVTPSPSISGKGDQNESQMGQESSPRTSSLREDLETRRQRAIDFLEGLVLSLLESIHENIKSLNERYMKQRFKVSKSSSKSNQASKKRKSSVDDNAIAEEVPGNDLNESDSQTDGNRQMSQSKCMTSWAGGSQASTQSSGKVHEGIVVVTKNRKTGGDQTIRFPEDPYTYIKLDDDRQSALDRMGCIFRVASLLHEAILTNTPTTKRDIFYKDVGSFKEQRVVDKIVDDLAATAGLKRADFCVCATSKGLIASSALRLFLHTGEELSMSATLATLIHATERIGRIEMLEPLSWVLIVEKDAVFNTLCNAKLLMDDRVGPGVIITGKGYPDLATLQLVARLADTFPAASFHALVDADPHGIDILSSYTFGSQASRFSKDHIGLDLGDRLQWLGVKASEWFDIGVGYEELLPLSDGDVNKALKMLRSRSNMPASWKRELCHMLHLNRKAEIEVILNCEAEEVAAGATAIVADQQDQVRQDVADSSNRLVEYVIRRLQR